MKRLKKETLESYRDTYDRYEGIESNEFERICDELIEYKSLEEELGIDLITLFKAFKNGIYYKGKDNTINFCKIKESIYVKLKDYGKTWALTKGELENE